MTPEKSEQVRNLFKIRTALWESGIGAITALKACIDLGLLQNMAVQFLDYHGETSPDAQRVIVHNIALTDDELN